MNNTKMVYNYMKEYLNLQKYEHFMDLMLIIPYNGDILF